MPLIVSDEPIAATPVPLGSGAVARVRPATSTEYYRALHAIETLTASLQDGEAAAQAAAAILGAEVRIEHLADPAYIKALGERLLHIELAALCVESWDGVEDKAGAPLPVAKHTLALLMRDRETCRRIVNAMNASLHQEVAGKKRIGRLAEWRGSGGGSYCANCRRAGTGCASGAVGLDGRRCPKREHRPLTIEGRAVIDTLARPGVWRRAGDVGMICGLDLAEAIATLPSCCDRDRARALFVVAETAFVAAMIKANPRGHDG